MDFRLNWIILIVGLVSSQAALAAEDCGREPQTLSFRALSSDARRAFIFMDQPKSAEEPAALPASSSDLEKGDELFEKGEYSEARNAYGKFIQRYGYPQLSAYAGYQIGMSFLNQNSTPHQDIEPVERAEKAFRNVMEKHPGTLYAELSQRELEICAERKLRHEYLIAMHYLRKGSPGIFGGDNSAALLAASKRLLGIYQKAKAPELPYSAELTGEALLSLAQAYERMQNPLCQRESALLYKRIAANRRAASQADAILAKARTLPEKNKDHYLAQCQPIHEDLKSAH